MQLLLIIYFACFATLCLYGLHRISLVAELFFRKTRAKESNKSHELPLICVQIPLYNEPAVAERVIEAVVNQDYPKDHLEIQVLDDSSDSTKEIVNACQEKYSARGYQIRVIRRPQRTGFKAGALSYGMQQSRAEYFAVFDADFVPQKSFLKKAMPAFEDQTAFVQAPWSFLNRKQSLLTRAQAVLLDGHFQVEHAARHYRSFFNFNGTAGIWRRKAIESAGGWQGDTLTEDLDLSYRARLAGWKASYLHDLDCPSELPETVGAFKSQQFRWMKGTAQVSKKLLAKIIKSKELSLIEKIDASMHLTAPICYLLTLVVSLLFIPVAYYRNNYQAGFYLPIELFIFLVTVSNLLMYFGYSQTRLGLPRFSKDILLAILLCLGMAPHCSRAVLSGFFGEQGEFVRTPKFGDSKSLVANKGDGFMSVFLEQKKELLLLAYFCLGFLLFLQQSLFLTIPFLCLLGGSYLLILSQAFRNYRKQFLSV